jgi:hypothetical protein
VREILAQSFSRRLQLLVRRRVVPILPVAQARATVRHMKLAIELPPVQADKLRAEAARLGLSPEDLARAALSDLLSTPDTEFQDAARRVLAKNRDLYKRLA